MENIETKLREEAKRLLLEKKVDVIIGYEKGTLPLTATPCFITTPEEADKLVWNNLCTQNLAKFVHDLITRTRIHKSASNRKTGRKKSSVLSPAAARPVRSSFICRKDSMTGMKFILSAFPATVMWTAKD